MAGVLLVATGALIATAAVSAHRRAPAAASERSELGRQVRARTAATDGLQHRLASLRRDVARERRLALRATREGAALEAENSALEVATGVDPVSGPGVRVSLSDAKPGDTTLSGARSAPTTPAANGRVLDRDLQDVVNALWAAGAEAVAVGDQRLTVQSAIRSAGDAILVDFRPVSSPYVVSAVGDPVRLEADFAASATARRLHSFTSAYGLGFTVRRADRVGLPAAAGLTLRQARPGGTAP
ncbi:MAG: DUF881 domain-containing protein [Mycobacteriales bacterium]